MWPFGNRNGDAAETLRKLRGDGAETLDNLRENVAETLRQYPDNWRFRRKSWTTSGLNRSGNRRGMNKRSQENLELGFMVQNYRSSLAWAQCWEQKLAKDEQHRLGAERVQLVFEKLAKNAFKTPGQ